jgi:hypothetical protein
MKKKHVLEADLDPPNTPRTRPGGETAKRARALSRRKPGVRGKSSGATRPGAHAANRAVADIRRREEEP